MKSVTYSETTVVRVTKEGLTYVDDEGIESFVDFDACHANFEARFFRGSPDRPKYIGVRYSVGASGAAGIELQTDTPTRFEFPSARPVVPPGTQFVPRVRPRGYFEFLAVLREFSVETFDHD
jgi:hypothetical protein